MGKILRANSIIRGTVNSGGRGGFRDRGGEVMTYFAKKKKKRVQGKRVSINND